MKSTCCFLFIAFMLFTCASLQAQNEQEPESLGLPGDNFNLYAALKFFQESETLEAFENKLNGEESEINNLDLDGDGQIDYIRVTDNVDDNVHNIVLQVAVSKEETQDIAVFTVENDNEKGVQIQVIGDEDLYGKDYIIEPNYDDNNAGNGGTPNPGYTGNRNVVEDKTIVVHRTTTVEVSSWPVIRYIFVPTYVVWRSPWYWGYYPPVWRPWRPVFWHQYYGYHYHWNYYYYGYYRRGWFIRYPRWNNFYYSGRRSRSPVFYTRRERGDYRQTYSRPDLTRQGSDMFRKKNPKAPTVDKKVPTIKVPPRPSVTRPVTRPVVPPRETRPGGGVRPNPAKPVTRPLPQKPVTRPVTRPIEKPVTRPIQKPVTRPVQKPVNRLPQAKPAAAKPTLKRDLKKE